MPRRKAAERSQPHKSRSRNGCLTCRKRKIRCDEAKPSCSNCCDKGLPCQRGVKLKWEQEYASRGLAFGRCGVWSKHGASPDDAPRLDSAGVQWLPLPHIHSYHFVNTTIDGFEESLAEQEELGWFCSTENGFLDIPARPSSASSSSSISGYSVGGGALVPFTMSSPVSTSSLLLSPSAFPQLENPAHAPLLTYYLDRLCPLTTPSTRLDTPFASLILPFSVHASPNALNSVLALSARHLSRLHPAWKPTALRLEGQVLHSLRRRLLSTPPTALALDPETPTIMMLLCLYEIINACDQRWVVHLRGARDLIRTRRRLLPQPTPDPLLAFSERFFAYQDVIGRTACGEAPLFDHEYWRDDDDDADAWLGCSPRLVALVCAVTELSRARRHAAPDDAHRDATAALESQLRDLHQRVPTDDAPLRAAADAKLLAARLYLAAALRGLGPGSPLVANLVQRILRIVDEANGAGAGLAWPLFVAAVELEAGNEDEGGRVVVLRALGRMAGRSVANVGRVREVVSRVWGVRDGEVGGAVVDGEEEGGRNDWERVVAPLSGNMSLVG